MMTLFLLFMTGLFAGTIDAIAGGGGLISLPMLLSLGMPPHLAFGTNKLQGVVGTFVAARRYYNHGLISIEKVYRGIIFGIIGSIAGAMTSQMISGQILQIIVPVLLAIVLFYTILSPKMGSHDLQPRMNEHLFFTVFGFFFGFYDGFFGPATGSFWVFAFTSFLGFNLIKATAYTKIFNLNSSVIATICFGLGGNIDYKIALCMAAGSLIGGRLGASLAIKKGNKVIRPLFLLVVGSTMMTLLYRNYAHSELLNNLIHDNLLLIQTLVFVSIILSVVFYFRRRLAKAAIKS
jgi:uncharacterized membrane protein YfcA